MNAAPPLPTQYSCEIFRSDGKSSRVYVDGEKRRVENGVEAPTQINITRPDLGRVFILYPQQKTFLENEIPDDALSLVEKPNPDFAWETNGQEQLEGRVCEKFRAYSKKDKRTKEVLWVDFKTRMRVRLVTYNLSGEPALTANYRNVVIGRVDESVFEVPEDYKKFKT
jgi:outer membrane lipoprotein-sorting protein